MPLSRPDRAADRARYPAADPASAGRPHPTSTTTPIVRSPRRRPKDSTEGSDRRIRRAPSPRDKDRDLGPKIPARKSRENTRRRLQKATADCRAQVKEYAQYHETSWYTRHKMIKSCIKDALAKK